MENKTIKALEKLVTLKDETIKELERQIQLLKNAPNINLNVPFVPLQQPYQPYVGSPSQPLQPPFIITSVSGTTAVTLTGDPLPLGSVQSNLNNVTYINNGDLVTPSIKKYDYVVSRELYP